MELRDARTIPPRELMERRKQAVMLHQKGMPNTEIASVVGVHRNTVGQWIDKWASGGLRSLSVKASGRPKGTGRRLTPEQEKALRRMLVDKNPEQYKMDFALWTRAAVRDLIQRQTGIPMPIRTVGEYLKRWGYTPQKPVRRAYERCDKSVRRWLDEEYPAIAEKARRERAEIHWGDETGLRSDDVNGRGYAPRGKTPTRRMKGTPEKINMISTVTNKGKVRFMFYRESLNVRVLKRFLERLLRDTGGRKVYLILDNLRVHRAAAVRSWAEERADRIEIFYLPSYSPDLNPDEYLNNDLKGEVNRRADSRHKGKLAKTALSAMRRIQKKPSRVRKYFDAEPIRYAS